MLSRAPPFAHSNDPCHAESDRWHRRCTGRRHHRGGGDQPWVHTAVDGLFVDALSSVVANFTILPARTAAGSVIA